MLDWTAPPTWQVGDKFNAETWNDKWIEPMSVLLRRPLTILRKTASVAIAGNTNWNNTYINFDTCDKDDDNMVQNVLPTTTLYVTRSGTFDIWASAAWISNGSTGNPIGIGLEVNGNTPSVRGRETRIGSVANAEIPQSLDACLRLIEGDTLRVTVMNMSPSNCTINNTYNSPRFAMFWRGPAT